MVIVTYIVLNTGIKRPSKVLKSMKLNVDVNKAKGSRAEVRRLQWNEKMEKDK